MNKQELLERRANAYERLEDAHKKNDNFKFNEAKSEFDDLNFKLQKLEIDELRASNVPENFEYHTQRNSTELIDNICSFLDDPEKRTTSTTGSGALQDPLISNEYFAAAAAKIPFNQQTKITYIPGISNYTQYPVYSNVTPYWQANEGDLVTDSPMTITGKKFQLRTIAIMVKISKQLRRDSDPLVRQIVDNGLMMALLDEIGRVILRGNGVAEPLGLDGVGDILEIDASGSNLTNWGYHLNALSKVHTNGARPENCSWIGGTNDMLQIESFKDTTNQYLAKPPVLEMMPYVYTNHVGENYNTNKTRMYLGDFSNVVVGINGPFILNLTQRYADTLTDAFLLWAGIDVLVKRPKEIARVVNIGKL